MTEAPAPINKLQLKAYLGLLNHYRKFVPNMATIVHHLCNLLKDNTDWMWSDECQRSFDRLKQVITSPDVLVHYNPSLKIKLTCDASNYGLGAVFSRVFENGIEKPISFVNEVGAKDDCDYSYINYVDTANIGLILDSVRTETKQDEELKLVLEYIQH